jgi:hypothetical protein
MFRVDAISVGVSFWKVFQFGGYEKHLCISQEGFCHAVSLYYDMNMV